MYASLKLPLIQFKLPLIHMEDNIYYRTLTRHLPNTHLLIKRQVTQTMPQQLHLAISAQFIYPLKHVQVLEQTQGSNT